MPSATVSDYLYHVYFVNKAKIFKLTSSSLGDTGFPSWKKIADIYLNRSVRNNKFYSKKLVLLNFFRFKIVCRVWKISAQFVILFHVAKTCLGLRQEIQAGKIWFLQVEV